MHEISLVRNIFRTLEEEFPADMDRIRGIYLKADYSRTCSQS
ncbi:hypothetical protein [Spirosoma telluris]